METEVTRYWKLASGFNNEWRANLWLQMHTTHEQRISQQGEALWTVSIRKTYNSNNHKPATVNASEIIWINEKVYQKCRVNVQDVGKRHYKSM